MDLASEKPTNFTLVVFYRDLHCRSARGQLRGLDSKLDELETRGVLTLAAAPARLSLYVSSGHGKTWRRGACTVLRPAIHFVRPDATLYFGNAQTVRFVRPHFSDMLPVIDCSEKQIAGSGQA